MQKIEIIGQIDSEMVGHVAYELNNASGPIEVELTSEGGSVIAGLAIASAIRKYPETVTTRVVGGSYSIASWIFLAGDEREIEADALIHFHSPRVGVDCGDLQDHRDSIAELERASAVMVKRLRSAGMSEKNALALMEGENFFSADEAIRHGIATCKIDSFAMTASRWGVAKMLASAQVSTKIAQGLTRQLAVMEVYKESPKLRERMLAEANPPRRQPKAKVNRPMQRARAAIQEKADELRTLNPRLRPRQAFCQAMVENPKLREAFVREANR